jgi:hypothetical protein
MSGFSQVLNKNAAGFTQTGGTLSSKGFGTSFLGGGQAQPPQYILEGVAFELELKSSDLADYASKGLLEALVLQASFEQDNIYDILISGDLSQNAQFEMVNISGDKRALRER